MDDNPITYFAQTDFRNRRTPFGIKASDRTRHIYVIGKTGMGKSTLLENMAIQDIQNGNGLAFVDPHGKSAELLLDYVPENRINDVLYFAPFDMDFPVSFNVMEDVGPDKRHLVVNGLMSTFEKIWVDAWSARMAYILSNTLLALLEYPDSTLLGINRMLSDKDYRKMVIANVKDPSVRSFWVDEFSKYTDRYAQEATPAIQNKVGQFTSNPLIRNIIGQPKSTFDLRKMMDEKKIIIVNLSKGRVGEGNANLLGSMFITKFYLAAMSRADVAENKQKALPNSYLYVDEFQSFANKSFADILSEARKYKLNLTIAHQYIEQMEEEVRAAVFGNVGTMITFRVGAYDAEVIEKEFAPVFTAEDLVNLGIFQIYLKLMIDGVSSTPFSAVTLPPIEKPIMSFKEDVITASRKTYARTRESVESEVRLWHDPVKLPEKEEKKKVAKGEERKTEKSEFSRSPTNVLSENKDMVSKNEFAKAFAEAGLIASKLKKDFVAETPKPVFAPEVVVNVNQNQAPMAEPVLAPKEKIIENFSRDDKKTNRDDRPKDFLENKGAPREDRLQNRSQFSKPNFKGDDKREENMSALREALAQVISADKNKKIENVSARDIGVKSEIRAQDNKTAGQQAVRDNSFSHSSNGVDSAPGKNEERKSEEVSPEVLKKILSSDEPPAK